MFGVIKRNPTISIADLFRSLIMKPKSIEKVNCSYTGYSRFALYNILKLLKFGKGDRILLPAYNCDVVVASLLKLGIEPSYYGVAENFQIDYSTIKLHSNTKAIITVNYFGLSQDYDAIQTFVNQHNLIWLNDNSHGFASCHGDKKLESYGDFSFTSFRKIIPSINGSRTCINNEAFIHLHKVLSECNGVDKIERKIFRFLVATLFSYLKYRPVKVPDYSALLAEADEELMDYKFDGLSSNILSLISEDWVQHRRYQTYEAIGEFIMARKYGFVQPISGLLKEGNSPMLYPLRVINEDVWRSILRISRDLGIDIHTWPTMPQEVIKGDIFGSVSNWRGLIFLPLHQDIKIKNYCVSIAEVLDQIEMKNN